MTKDPFADFISSRTRTEPHSPANFWILILVVLALLAFAVSKLDNNDTSELLGINKEDGEAIIFQSRIYSVTYKFGVFSPTNLRIRVGDTVTFKNIDSRNIRISSQLNPQTKRAEFDSIGPVPPGSAFSYTFVNEGIFAYHNVDNKRQAGVIIVRAP